MEDSSSIDLAQLAKHLNLDVASLQTTVELLEEGNTVPFITRFRKDQTGGLDEQQIRTVQRELARHKQLHERKESILKSIESRQQLTPELRQRIQSAKTMRVLEDLYLPYKPKKKSLAYVARSRGLGPLAEQIIQATGAAVSLEEAAAKLVDPEKELADQEAVLHGVQHLVAEHFCNDSSLRSLLRRHMWQNGRLVSKKIEDAAESDEDDADSEPSASDESHEQDPAAEATEASDSSLAENADTKGTADAVAAEDAAAAEDASPQSAPAVEETPAANPETTPEQTAAAESPDATQSSQTSQGSQAPAADSTAEDASASASGEESAPEAGSGDEGTEAAGTASESTASPSAAADAEKSEEATTAAEGAGSTAELAAAEMPATETATPKPKSPAADPREKKKAIAREQRRATRRRRRERLVQSFKDYFDFKDPLGKLPHHRILAINRGERTKVLRVKIECGQWEKLFEQLRAKAFDAQHPYAEFLGSCLQDAVNRLLVPSIEREVRRELNDRAEEHAVKVFAKNLRKLLLQPPLSGHRVIAIDPGFRSGCKVVALDEFGKLLGHTFINLLGKDQQREQGRQELAKFAREHKANVIAVGNGAACRETETLVGELLVNELRDEDIGYLIVNEAGTSVYSTSELGREELPDVDPTVRSAVSIGRRALDPLSELVKVDPASIGVGLYQHDVKAKHLRESLDDVVESCVNYVGVDVNSASPSLLRYVSGLNKMTANQIYKHREQHGPFKTREELKAVSGIGDSTYVQAAGFLKIKNGENALDGTWIHPESYSVAERILAALGFESKDLALTRSRLASEEGAKPEATPATPTSPATPTEDSTEPAESAVATAETTTDSTEATAPAAEEAPQDADTAVPEADASETGDASDTGGSPSEAEAPAEGTSDTTTPTDEDSSAAAADTAANAPTAADADTASTAETAPAASAQSERFQELHSKLRGVDASRLAPQLKVGKLLLQDILTALARPGRDPREDLPRPPFRKGVLKLEDLKPGMELSGTVLNVVDFGAFVDIGLVDSGLIHVSRLADKYVSDPHDVVSVGDILRVWVVDVDNSRRRVSLTAIEPGTERPKREREPRKPRESREKQAPRGGKKRREDRRGAKRGGGSGSGHKPKEYRSKAKPKPLVPITKEMENGQEPMRTFGDLKQLFDKKRNKGKG